MLAQVSGKDIASDWLLWLVVLIAFDLQNVEGVRTRTLRVIPSSTVCVPLPLSVCLYLKPDQRVSISTSDGNVKSSIQ